MTNIGTTFRNLHNAGGAFILANAWDAGSAKMLEVMGAKSIATSSAAHAFTLGKPDMGTLSRDEALAHAQTIVAAVTVPVQGDFENGFGEDPDTCAQTVRLAAEVGLAGICIEDTALPATDPYAFELSVERIRAAVSAARDLPNDFILTARADGILTGHYDINEAIKRLQAYADAGADCLYAPMPKSMADLARICREVDGPINALVAGPFTKHTRDEFIKAGVARLSLGSALSRITHRAILDAGTAMFGTGDFTPLGHGVKGDTIDAMLEQIKT